MDEEELRHRVKNAIILLTVGHPFRVGELTFSSKDKTHFFVTGWTRCNDLQSLTKQRALTELYETKDIFIKMLNISSELVEFIKGKQVNYCLGYDYGMGGVEICRETDGQLQWATTLKE